MSNNEITTKKCGPCGLELSLTEFYADKTKKHGRSSACKACSKKKTAKAKAANPEKHRALVAAWQEANRDRCRELSRNWHHKNRDKAIEKSRQYYWDNRNDALQKHKLWEAENRDVVRRLARETYERNKGRYQEKNRNHYAANKELYRARDRNRQALELSCDGSHTAQEILDLFDRQYGLCAIPHCREPLQTSGKDKFHADHMVPLSRGGSNGIGNIQLTCPTCNKQKGAKTMEEFLNVYRRPE